MSQIEKNLLQPLKEAAAEAFELGQQASSEKNFVVAQSFYGITVMLAKSVAAASSDVVESEKYVKMTDAATQKLQEVTMQIGSDSGENSFSDLCIPITANKSFDDLAGMKREKNDMMTDIVFPSLYPAMFVSQKAVLFYGPPGTGKTELVKAAVTSLNANTGQEEKVFFFSADGASLKGKYVGETEKRIRGTFQCAAAAAGANNLSVIFMDEIDAIGADRGTNDNMANSVNALISSIEGATSEQFDNVKIMAATNLPWRLDSALNRRFSKRIFVDLPNAKARAQIVSNRMQKYFILDPKMRAEEEKLAKSVGNTKQRRLLAAIETQKLFLNADVVNSAPKTDQGLLQLKAASRGLMYPEIVLEGKNDVRADFSIAASKAKTSANNWAEFLRVQNPNGDALSVDQLMRISAVTGMDQSGHDMIKELANDMGQSDYLQKAEIINTYAYTRVSDNPALFGYSASDVSKMVDQAINIAAVDFATQTLEKPTEDLCVNKLGVLKMATAQQCQANTCCTLLPSANSVCSVSAEHRKCIRSTRITLDHVLAAVSRFRSTVDSQSYLETLEYFLSGGAVAPGSPAARAASLLGLE